MAENLVVPERFGVIGTAGDKRESVLRARQFRHAVRLDIEKEGFEVVALIGAPRHLPRQIGRKRGVTSEPWKQLLVELDERAHGT